MYASFFNQAANFSKFLFAFLFLFALLPFIITGRIDEDKADNVAAGFIRSVFTVIVIGYVLVATKTFEFITLFAIILFLLYRRMLFEAKLLGRKSQEGTGLLILKVMDRQINVLKTILNRIKNILSKPGSLQLNVESIVFTILACLVLLVSAYLRFYDAFAHAAMPLSDSYITLDWFKGVDRRQLFYEPGGGVYPRGLSIYMATIHKFSFIDPLYVLKYCGPLNGLLIVISIFYVVYKITKSKYAALIATSVYGIGAGLLGSEIVRQAATNSQEFALIFLLPTIYFSYKFSMERRQRDCRTVVLGLTLMGLIHTFVYLFGVIVVGMNILVLFMKGPRKNFKDYGSLILGGFFSAVISLIPFAVGLFEGIGLHGSSVEFLTSTGDITLKELLFTDYLAIAGFLIFGILLLRRSLRRNADSSLLLPVLLIIVSTFLLYSVGGYITKSTLLETRTKEIWAVYATLSIGLGIGSLISTKASHIIGRIGSVILCLVTLFFLLRYVGIKPLDPYKMEWDSGVEQYLRIAKEYSPKSWTMVAEERQYAMVTGTGFLITTAHFIQSYDAKEPFQENWNEIGEHIFIYQQKNIFQVSEANSIYPIEAPKYAQMKIDGRAMEQWLEDFTASGGIASVYYEDENIRVLYIHNKAYEHEVMDRLWG